MPRYFINFIPKGIFESSDYVLDIHWKLRRVIQNECRGEILLYTHDNAKSWTVKITKAFLEDFKWDLVPHPPHSPELSLSNYHLLKCLHDAFAGREFENKGDIKTAVCKYFKTLAPEHYALGIQKLIK